VIDDRSNGEVKITVISTGFAPREELVATTAYEPNARQYFATERSPVPAAPPSYSVDDLDIPAFLRDRR
jgi:hypothetical protein